MALSKDENKESDFNTALEFIYKNTNNISTWGLISSVAVAHPNPFRIGKSILPLFQDIRFFFWDISRLTGEFNALAPKGDILEIQLERYLSNQLPHRKKRLEV